MHRAILLALAMLAPGLPAAAADRFTLTEHFGVSHPDQIVTFDLKQPVDPQKTVVYATTGQEADATGADAKAAVEVPYQLLAGGKKLAVRTGLAANETKVFTLRPGTPKPADPDAVTVKETTGGYEITTRLTGIRVPKPVPSLPFPAPVQGVRLRDGTWTANKATLSVTPPEKTKPRMSVDFIEKGPLKTVVRVRYDFAADGEAAAAKEPNKQPKQFSTTTIALEAGQPSILFEEEADLDRSYGVEMFDAVHPTQARYRGHHSDSQAAGYEPDGQVYRMSHARPALDAQIDLTYSGPRSYGRVARWDPWVYNTGWYWQMFDDQAGPEGNLVGAFAGRASRQVGSGMSGVEGYTAPAGMSDLVSAVDATGVIHCVYAGNGGLWHVAIDELLKPGKPAKIAAGLINPDLAVLADGSVSVIAYDPQARQFVELQGRTGSEFINRPVAFTGADGGAIADPYAYQAIRGDTQFLLFYGNRAGKQEGLLFSRAAGEKAFVFRGAVGGLGYCRQVNRPSFAAMPDGRVILVTDVGGYAARFEIKPGALTLTGGDRLPLNFGVALDPVTGGYTVGNQEGKLYDYPASGKSQAVALQLPVDHGGQGANRRTLATAPDGTAVLLFGGNSDNAYQQTAYRRSGGTWTAWPEATQFGLACTRVSYHAPSGQFVFLGRKDGKLAAYAGKPADSAPQDSSTCRRRRPAARASASPSAATVRIPVSSSSPGSSGASSPARRAPT